MQSTVVTHSQCQSVRIYIERASYAKRTALTRAVPEQTRNSFSSALSSIKLYATEYGTYVTYKAVHGTVSTFVAPTYYDFIYRTYAARDATPMRHGCARNIFYIWIPRIAGAGARGPYALRLYTAVYLYTGDRSRA